YIEALEIRRKALGDNDSDTATSINNLATLYYNKGDYTKAESLYIEALEIRRKALGDNHSDTATSINNLATPYNNKGDYSKAESLHIEALDIRRKIFGDNHPDTAQSINNLATLYNNKGDYSKAEPLYIQALEIYRKTFGDNHLDTAVSINNLANFYNNKGDYSKAESLYIQALDIRRKILGDNHPDTATFINNLAYVYFNEGDYSKAESLYIQVLDIYRKTLGSNYPNTATSINSLAAVYSSKGDYEKAVKYSQEASDAREVELTRNLSLGSERQKQLYLQLYAHETDITVSLHVQSAPTNPLAKQLALTQILRRKGRSIDAVNQSVEALRKRSKPEDVALLDELSGKKALFSNLSIQGLGKRSLEDYQKQIKTLQDEIEKLEYKISESSAEFRTQVQPITLQAVQQVVPTDSTLVEFASYRPYDSKTRKYAESRYVVYLLNNQGEIDWVDLGDAEAIDELVAELRGKLRNSKSSVLREIKPLSRKLDKLVMEPVRKLAGKGKWLLIAPDGTLNLVPFAALVDENGKFLLENNSISYLTSGRDLLRLKIKIESKQQPVILADPDFGTLSQVSKTSSPKEGETIFASLKFKRLAATELEAKAIKTLFPNAEMLLQKQASEEALTKLNAPSILHIATHGFFLQEKAAPVPPTPDEQRLATFEGTGRATLLNIKVENPLLRSGLALSGANLRTDDKEQGIFTALKTTGLNLWGTKVVVLSACDTGVGEVKTGDG
ncbi:MAG: peptidase-like protein, partial [bacterium]